MKRKIKIISIIALSLIIAIIGEYTEQNAKQQQYRIMLKDFSKANDYTKYGKIDFVPELKNGLNIVLSKTNYRKLILDKNVTYVSAPIGSKPKEGTRYEIHFNSEYNYARIEEYEKYGYNLSALPSENSITLTMNDNIASMLQDDKNIESIINVSMDTMPMIRISRE